MKFSERTRALYWLFWNTYTLRLDNDKFKKLFNVNIAKKFKFEISIALLFGLLSREGDSYQLTKRQNTIYGFDLLLSSDKEYLTQDTVNKMIKRYAKRVQLEDKIHLPMIEDLNTALTLHCYGIDNDDVQALLDAHRIVHDLETFLYAPEVIRIIGE